EVKRFNRENQYRKRGIAMNPTKLGLGFTRKHMYQATALIHIYRDGTVLLTHGGKLPLDNWIFNFDYIRKGFHNSLVEIVLLDLYRILRKSLLSIRQYPFAW
ncbi:unnamed protein product, partial [Rotaria magnacalcarata]